MTTWLRRAALLLMFLLIGGAVVTVSGATMAFADCAYNDYSPECQNKAVPEPPKNLVVTAANDGSVVLYWDPTGAQTQGSYQVTQNVAAIDVYRGSDKLASLPAEGFYLPKTYTDPNPPQGGEVAYTVKALGTSGQESGPSNEVKVTPVQHAQTEVTPVENTTDSATPDVTGPDLAGGGAPTAFEAYGGSSIGSFASTFAADSWLTAAETFPVRVGWRIIVYLDYMALVFLAWSISPNLYSGIISGVTALASGIFSLSAYSDLTQLAALAGGVSLVILAFKHQFRNIGRAVTFMLLGVISTAAYSLHTDSVVTAVLSYPTQATSYVLGWAGELSNSMATGVHGNGRLGIVIQPGYTGVNPAYDGVRQFQEAEFINTVYAGKCRLNFGNLAWSTRNTVPIRDDAPDSFKTNLTWCEYLVKADHDNNQTEQDYLADQVNKRAPPDVKAVFTGEDAGSQYGILFFLSLAILFRAALLFLCAYVFAMCVLALGIMLIKGVFLVLGWYVPYLEPYTTRWAQQMGLKFALPPLMSIWLIIGLFLTTIILTTTAATGWEIGMVMQVIAAMICLSLGFMTYRKQRKMVQNINASRETQWDKYRSPQSSGESAPEVSPGIAAQLPTGSYAALDGGSSAASSQEQRASKKQLAVEFGAAALTGGTTAVTTLATKKALDKGRDVATDARDNFRDHVTSNRVASPYWYTPGELSQDERDWDNWAENDAAARQWEAEEAEREAYNSFNPRPPSATV